jgi:tight adherence protein B
MVFVSVTALLTALCASGAIVALCSRPGARRLAKPAEIQRRRMRWNPRRRRVHLSHAVDVAAFVSAIATELRSGRPTTQAWDAVVSTWSGALPAGRASSSALPGIDVARVQLSWSGLPGWGSFRAVAACWHLADESGVGLADALDRLAVALRHEGEIATEIHGQLSSVRATATVLATLPVVALAMGNLLGAHPFSFLVQSPIGWSCLAGGASLVIVGWAWLNRQVDDVSRALRW